MIISFSKHALHKKGIYVIKDFNFKWMLFFWTFYSSNNPEMFVFTEILSSTTVFKMNNNNNKCFLEHQISISEWFLKDYVMKTRVMTAEM